MAGSRGRPPPARRRPRRARAPAQGRRPPRPRAPGRPGPRATSAGHAGPRPRRGRRDRRRTTRRNRGCRGRPAPRQADRPRRRRPGAASGPARTPHAGHHAPRPPGRRAGRGRGSRAMNGILGWDIGGVNTKGAYVADAQVLAARAAPYELQRDPAALVPLLGRLAQDLGAGPAVAHGVTMTAELSQLFRTKREGVGFVLDAVAAAFPDACVRVWGADARWRTPKQARSEPLAVAAANWAATAHVVGRMYSDCLLVDVGSTTTDVIPIRDGAPVACGRTDVERLQEGELLYTGALRTPVEAIAPTVPVRGRSSGVSAEGFALAGDVHVWRGELAPADYSVPTPDGRPATKRFAGERLARVVCSDRETLDETDIDVIADALWDEQVTRIAAGLERVGARQSAVGRVVATGLGEFLAAAAARRIGLQVTHLSDTLGPAARHAPAAAVALLFPS